MSRTRARTTGGCISRSSDRFKVKYKYEFRQAFPMRAALLAIMAVLIIAGCVGQTAPAAPSSEQPAGGAPQKVTTPESLAVSVTVTEGPTKVQVGKLFTVKWTVVGPAGSSTNDTRVYYDTVSRAGSFAAGVTPKTSGYRSFTPTQSGALPGEFSVGVSPGPVGNVLFYRSYAMVDGQNYWSDEYELNQVVSAPTVAKASVPSNVTGGYSYSVSWKVEGGLPGNIESSYLEWGLFGGQYDHKTDAQTGTSPMTFTVSLTAPSAPNTVYIRMHAVVDGKEYTTEESSIPIK
jgi:hypothetical protein